MTRRYEKLPENINQMSDKEIEELAQTIWEKFTTPQHLVDRQTQLMLRQKAYSIWINKYPHENDDDSDCHLEEIYSWLLSEYVKR